MYIDSTLTSQENVISLVNVANENKLTTENTHVHSPVAYVPVAPDINNTVAKATAIKGGGLSGTTDVVYRRADIMEVTFIPVRGFDVFRGMTAALLQPIAEMTLGLPPGNITVQPFINNAPTVRIDANVDSLLTTGSGEFDLNWL